MENIENKKGEKKKEGRKVLKVKKHQRQNEKRNNYLKKKIENERKIKIIKNKNFKEKASRINILM